MGVVRKRIICGYFNDFILGGIESYYMRMFEWGKKRNYECVLALPRGKKIHDEWEKDIERLGVIEAFYNKSVFSTCLKDHNNEPIIWNKEDENVFITADIHSYLKMKYIKSKNSLNKSKVILYILHPFFCRSSKKKWVNIPYNFIIKQLFNGGIAFMDEETASYCEEFYNIKGLQNKIVRLGIFVKDWTEIELSKKIASRDKFTILTICRMDFPFKGYVCGLVKIYSILKERYPQIELLIIGDGPDKSVLLEEIEPLDDRKKKDIHLIGEVAYDKLQQYFAKASVYVGMGTTLLDASNEGVISIVSTAYKMEAVTPGLFSQFYNNLSGCESQSNQSLKSMEEVLRFIVELNSQEYIDLSKIAHDTVLNYYDIDKSMEQILSMEDKVKVPSVRFLALRFYDLVVAKLQELGIG